jgi:hypothetical protein
MAQAPAAAAVSARPADLLDFSFADLLDVINPFQHIPVVSTLYRNITGDRIGTPEKIADDTLYGGVVGFVASLADTAFQELTGKNVGDTVLAFLTGGGTAVAAAPASVTPAAAVSVQTPDVSALMRALSGNGIDAGSAARAYSRTVGMTAAPLPPPL